MKLLLLLILLPVSAGANSNYYNNYGTYEGTRVDVGNYGYYYNYRGDFMGTQVTTPNPAPVYQPAPKIELAPIPGSYEGITPPGLDMIGDPE